MTCSRARPKEVPTARARCNTSSEVARCSTSRASACALLRRPSKRSNADSHCGTRSPQSAAKRSSSERAAALPQSIDGGMGSSSPRPSSPATAAPRSMVRFSLGSKRRQSSSGAPGSRQTRRFDGEPKCRSRMSSIFAGTATFGGFSGSWTTSRLVQPMAERRMRNGSTFRRWPSACATACETLWIQASASGPLKEPKSSEPQRSSSISGWRKPGSTSCAAAAVAGPCSPSMAATSSRRAAMPPTSTHSGKRSRSSRTPSTSETVSSWLRTSLNAQAMVSAPLCLPRAPGTRCPAPMARAGVGMLASTSRCRGRLDSGGSVAGAGCCFVSVR
mmetsp:Transcript_99377/g.320498  ORF Transcript_99377/g.320498 Transcript_99377/m.320498 type:complete len:332 (+) Transcript_99377:1398-2393(+)